MSGIIGLVILWGSPDESLTPFELDKNDPPTIFDYFQIAQGCRIAQPLKEED